MRTSSLAIEPQWGREMSVQASALRTAPAVVAEPFLRIPPFPGAKIDRFAVEQCPETDFRESPEELAHLIRSLRVGGTFWAAQPQVPDKFFLVKSAAAIREARVLAGDLPVVFWADGPRLVSKEAHTVVTGECDPWHLVGAATGLVLDFEDETSLVAALLGIPTYRYCAADQTLRRQELSADALLEQALNGVACLDPFTGQRMSLRQTIELCGFWRNLIDGNREITGGLGFAYWKRENVGALLWNGMRPFHFARTLSEIDRRTGDLAVWRSKAPAGPVEAIEKAGGRVIEVEDGFLRSQGLGADCVPPLSITVDRLGAHFDPARPSELELLLQDGDFDVQLLDRARRLRRQIVEAGLSKYSQADIILDRPAGSRLHILVPGQVEDDRSVQLGGCGLATNLDLLAKVRANAPDAYILYKPHPDVVAGHRKGAILDETCLEYADEIVGDAPISSLIAVADEIHVNTSLAGFEALIRGKAVTTYGVPFYAGWGLSRDLGPIPGRRSTKRTVDELVAATLLLYPRYLDPVTGLPCPPEVVASRLIGKNVPDTSLLVAMRRFQGKVLRKVRSLVQ